VNLPGFAASCETIAWSMQRRSGGLIALAASLVLLSACARTVMTSPPRPAAIGSEENGLASWYGHPYHGRPTASGEVYDMSQMTAAHRTLPFGTRVSVTNLGNARVAEVRINDRGPFVDGRLLDLSFGAASALDAVAAGVIPVRIRVIAQPAELSRGLLGGGAPGAFSVQVGAFAARAWAERLREAVAVDGTVVQVLEAVVAGETLYRVRLGPFPDKLTAQSAADRLAARGYLAVIIPER
jgi:rare lipoprotein A